MTPLQTNKRVFFDNDGLALEGGLIYVGQPSTDPRTNPKTVTLRDSGGSEFTASQPLKTKAGRVVYNGLPIFASVDGEYSMLIIDANGQQVEYSGSVNPPAEEGADQFTEITRVGLTLTDVKAFDVSVGDTVRSAGKATATDGLGADWLAVSATGTAADDIELIDFANGLQGRRVNNQAYTVRVNKTGTVLFDNPIPVVDVTLAGLATYRDQWVSIDLSANVPVEASSALVRVHLYCKYPDAVTADRLVVRAFARKTGETGGPPSDRELLVGSNYAVSSANAELESSFSSEFRIPIDPTVASDFDLYVEIQDPLVGSGNISAAYLVVSTVGYEIRYPDSEA